MPHTFGIVGVPKRGFGPLTKPAPGAVIDWQHPLAQDILLCATLSERGGVKVFDSGNKRNHGTITGATWRSNGLYFSNSTSNLVAFDQTKVTGVQGTVFAGFVTADVTQLQSVFSASNTANTIRFVRCDIGVSSKLAIVVNDGDTAAADYLLGSATLAANVLTTCGWGSTGTGYFAYVNGKSDALNQQAGTNGGDWFSDVQEGISNAQLGLLTRTSAAIPFNGVIEWLLIYSTVKNETVASQLHYAPYQFFWTKKRTIYVPRVTFGVARKSFGVVGAPKNW